ncbi:NAC domain-containing protein 7-like [Pyrus ussuriensis x Pyrus communis]|uniref:NAC domain-containing protein 7-like n=1 Tax=Pyrus ussuriensis x Pyrus communis TaxID=2448454 RepID=A0A5N5HBV7_9ROSA|nr:NAC domain-containing protein 7-like [Pyrus ussuriensis x Pyrus communis]
MEVGYYGMPLGFRFHPTDQELVSSYLRDRALSGKPLGKPFIQEFNLFGQTPPWVVWEQFGGNSLLDQDLFFFYELRSRSDSDSRSKRQIEAGGTWSETSSDKVLGLDGIPIGDKGHFRSFFPDLKGI